jgi:hypothetical protein
MLALKRSVQNLALISRYCINFFYVMFWTFPETFFFIADHKSDYLTQWTIKHDTLKIYTADQ